MLSLELRTDADVHFVVVDFVYLQEIRKYLIVNKRAIGPWVALLRMLFINV